MNTVAYILWRASFGCLFLFLLVSAAADPRQPEGKSNTRMLSVRESLVPLFSIPDLPRNADHPYSVVTFPYDRLNPGIRRYVIAHLQDKLASKSDFSGCGDMLLLGVVCTPEDIEWMANCMESFLPKIGDREETRGLGSGFAGKAGTFFGMALVRHPEAAEKFVAKYSSPIGWAPLGTEKLPPMDLSPAQMACGQFVLFAYQFSRSEHLRTILHDQLENRDRSLGIGVGLVEYVEGRERSGYASYCEPKRVPREEQDRAVDSCTKLYGKQIDALIQRVNNPVASPRVDVLTSGIPVPQAGTEEVAAEPSAGHVPISGPAVSYAEALIQEGIAAYSAIAGSWAGGKADDLLGRILDNTEPTGDAKLQRLLKSPKQFDLQKDILLDVARLGAVSYRDFHISIETEMSWETPSLPNPGESVALAGSENVTLTFSISGSAAIRKQRLPGALSFPERCMAPNGDLRVFMRKIGGKWYWNPFGW